MIKLSICIPTFNRSQFLKICLANLEKQIISNQIEVIVIDNASSDNTIDVVTSFESKIPNLKYFKNDINLGYTGNQIKCYEYSTGLYTAFLSDDDVYLDGLVKVLLDLISSNDYDFIALNYYSFLHDFRIIKRDNFAPTNDIIFNRAYDILNYPSVGHWSGLIIKSDIAKINLKKLLNDKSDINYEKFRGIIGSLMHLSLSNSTGKSFFYGNRLLAVREPEIIDYNILEHLYLDNIKSFHQFYLDGIINKSDYEYRKSLVLGSLAKAILIESLSSTNFKMRSYENEFDSFLGDNYYYLIICKSVFFLSKICFIKFIFGILYKWKKSIYE